jgi:hypothetical protein
VVDPTATAVRVERAQRWSGPPPILENGLSDRTLTLTHACDPAALSCRVDLHVVLPAPAALTATLTAGEVDVGLAAGEVEARVGAGDVILRAPAGEIVASTGSGALILDGAAGGAQLDVGEGSLAVVAGDLAEVTVAMGVGDVSLELSSTPEAVQVVASEGDLFAWLPAGTYDWEAESGDGVVSVAGLGDPGDGPPVDLVTGRGNIAVEGTVVPEIAAR